VISTKPSPGVSTVSVAVAINSAALGEIADR
jgi:Mrp family chromosome partitioning ATPase